MNKEIAPVLDKISAILKEHDMAGLIVVGNKTHVDYRMEISPSWSCARIEPIDEKSFGIRIRSKLADYQSREAQKDSLEKTVGCFVSFEHTLTTLRQQMENLLVMIAHHVDFDGKTTRED